MKKYKVLVCGVFDFENMATGGQPVKTRELYYVLVKRFGENNIIPLEICNWKKAPFKLLFSFFQKALYARDIIMLPAHNGVLVFSFLLLIAKYLFKKKIYYDVIGGWLAEKTKHNRFLSYRLKKFDGIWVETTTMKNALEQQLFDNVKLFRNFKNLSPIKLNSKYCYEEPLKLCTFSRVMEEKGITDAINAVIYINNIKGRCVCELDIYGQIDDAYSEKFYSLMNSYNSCIHYKGVVRPDQSVETIAPYYTLLFPTHFYTEGIPGTIIDSYFAGVPVISAEWVNASDVVENGQTGYLYRFGDYQHFLQILLEIVDDKNRIICLKPNCVEKAKEYSTQFAICYLEKLLDC